MEILELLDLNNIPYELYRHEAVATVAQAKEKAGHVPGRQTKNLFLCDDKKQRFYLLTAPEDSRIDLKKLRSFLGERSLRFAPPEKLWDLMGLKPGAVSPFGLINDSGQQVSFLLHGSLLQENELCLHPNDNSQTVSISLNDFFAFLKLIGRDYVVYQPKTA